MIMVPGHLSPIQPAFARFLLLLLLLAFSASRAQNFGYVYIGFDKKYAEKDLDKQVVKGTRKSITSYSKRENGDTLIYGVNNEVECMTIQLTFNHKDTLLEEQLCDYQEYSFDCPVCAKKHLEEMIRMNKLRLKSGNTYLASYFNKFEMTVVDELEKEGRMRLIFRRVELSKKEYKALYNSLGKK